MGQMELEGGCAGQNTSVASSPTFAGLDISALLPVFTMTDLTASAKSLKINLDSNIAYIHEKASANATLLGLDLANNAIQIYGKIYSPSCAGPNYLGVLRSSNYGQVITRADGSSFTQNSFLFVDFALNGAAAWKTYTQMTMLTVSANQTKGLICTDSEITISGSPTSFTGALDCNYDGLNIRAIVSSPLAITRTDIHRFILDMGLTLQASTTTITTAVLGMFEAYLDFSNLYVTTLYGIYFPNKIASGHIGSYYAFKWENQGAGADITDLIVIDIDAPTRGTNSNIGIRNNGTLSQIGVATFTVAPIAPYFQTSTAEIVPTGGSTIPLLLATAIGGTGQPATANMDGWIPIKNSAGAVVFVPCWK